MIRSLKPVIAVLSVAVVTSPTAKAQTCQSLPWPRLRPPAVRPVPRDTLRLIKDALLQWDTRLLDASYAPTDSATASALRARFGEGLETLLLAVMTDTIYRQTSLPYRAAHYYVRFQFPLEPIREVLLSNGPSRGAKEGAFWALGDSDPRLLKTWPLGGALACKIANSLPGHYEGVDPDSMSDSLYDSMHLLGVLLEGLNRASQLGNRDVEKLMSDSSLAGPSTWLRRHKFVSY